MNNIIVASILMLGMFLCQIASARTIYYGKQTELVNIVYNSPTIFRFSALVKTVSSIDGFKIAPVDSNDPDFSTLMVSSVRKNHTGKILFVLNNGETIKLKLKTVSKELPEITDSIYDFKSKRMLTHQDSKSSVKISELELMKAMIRGDQITGYKFRKLVRTLWGFQKGLEVKLFRVYTGENFNGYVFGMRNRFWTKKKEIDISRIRLGGPNLAILAQIDNPILPARSDWTMLRVVSKPSSAYRDMKLPMGKIGKKEDI